jgi:hypothetical protein
MITGEAANRTTEPLTGCKASVVARPRLPAARLFPACFRR